MLWPQLTDVVLLDTYLYRMKRILIVKNDCFVKNLTHSSFDLLF